MIRSVIVPVAPGVEEMETVVIIDIFRRAGWEVVAAGLDRNTVLASRGVRIVPDCAWDSLTTTDFDIIAIPGGSKGTEALRKDKRVLETIRSFHRAGKLIGAICAAPLVLLDASILSHRTVTSHPSVASELKGAIWVDAPVVTDGNIITGRGAGASFEFSLAIVRLAGDCEKAAEIARSICLISPAAPSGGSGLRSD